MSDASALNTTLQQHLPAAWRCLSPLGRAAAFPRGIPFQASEAKQSKINATIGQLTDGRDQPLPLGPVAAGLEGLDPRSTFLYAPIDGPRELRTAWGARERRLAGAPTSPASLPFVTHGLTHGLSLLADLFVDPETDVVLPTPSWENYQLVFGLHARARIVEYPFFDGSRFNTTGLADALASVRSKALVVLNFPGNPTGYHPTTDEVHEIVRILDAHPGPAIVATDDAYQGWVYDEGRHPRSLFWDLCEAADLDRLLPIKIDGATKELVFFSSRVGFLTHAGSDRSAEEALLSKLKFLVRGTVGSASGPALAMVSRALGAPDLDEAFAQRRELLSHRWKILRSALSNLDPNHVLVNPFHGAFFALLTLSQQLDAEEARLQLLREHSVGTIAFPSANALRIAYCSIHADDLPELATALELTLGRA